MESKRTKVKSDVFQSQSLQVAVESVLAYFDMFRYPVTAHQVTTFLPKLATHKQVEETLETLESQNKVWACTATFGTHEAKVYAPLGHIHSQNEVEMTYKRTSLLIRRHRLYFSLLSRLPWINLIGISGSCAMDNARDLDDCDVFIMSAPGRIWLARFSAIILAKCLRTHRRWGDVDSHTTRGKICLNLFFDGKSCGVPEERRSLYTAHEVVQMRPIMIRGGAYMDFLEANKWALYMMPQAFKAVMSGLGVRRMPTSVLYKDDFGRNIFIDPILSVIERAVRRVQLLIMHERTSEIVSDSQLWFFPHDYSRTLSKKMP